MENSVFIHACTRQKLFLFMCCIFQKQNSGLTGLTIFSEAVQKAEVLKNKSIILAKHL